MAYFGPSLSPAHLKLADLPEGQVQLVDVQLDGGATSPFPLVKCNNIFVLPGGGRGSRPCNQPPWGTRDSVSTKHASWAAAAAAVHGPTWAGQGSTA